MNPRLAFAVFLFSTLLSACGEKTQQPASSQDSPKTNDSAALHHDSLPAQAKAEPQFLPGIELRISAKGDTTYYVANFSAYDSLQVEEVDKSGMTFDGIPSWVGEDSFPPRWSKMNVQQKMEYVNNFPGAYNQLCAEDPSFYPEPAILYPAYMRYSFSITPDRFRELRKIRRGAIDYLLEQKKTKDFTDHDIAIITDLNAIEFIPQLLRLEHHLRPLMLAQCGKKLKWKKDAHYQLIYSYTQVTGALINLLRQEHHKPFLDSQMERDYAAKLKERSAEEFKVKIAAPEELQEKDRKVTYFDPVYMLPVHRWFYVEEKLSAENAAFIGNCANDYWNNTPNEVKQKAGSRMAVNPVER